MPEPSSKACLLALSNEEKRQKILKELTEEEAAILINDWRFWARQEQLPPEGDWRIWFVCAGRGYGKTRCGAEWVMEQVYKTENVANAKFHIGLIAKTPADARDVMIEGESGLLNIGQPNMRPTWQPSVRKLVWPTGATAHVYSSKEFRQLRGPQHSIVWGDEIASWHYPRKTHDNAMFGLRHPPAQACYTSTPSNIPLVRYLMERAQAGNRVIVTGGSSYANVENLDANFIEDLVDQYEDTTLGQQEIYARLIADLHGALWIRKTIDKHRVPTAPELARVVVGVDPGISSEERAAETGIIVAGIGYDYEGYLIDDVSVRGRPQQWAERVVKAYYDHEADEVVAEINQGGEMVAFTIATVDPNVPVKVLHVHRGKRTRAEPVAALQEQGRIHHVGMFAKLEDQLCTWLPGERSPDRLDAYVHALSELMLDGRAPGDLGIS